MINKLGVLILIYLFVSNHSMAQSNESTSNEFEHFENLISSRDGNVLTVELDYINKNWKPEYEIMVLELLNTNLNNSYGSHLLELLEKKTKQEFGYDLNAWYEWIWNKEENLIPDYHRFKAKLNERIDSHFPKYFLNRQEQEKRTIRLDEIRWGGVLQDGIPPLRNPLMINVNEADYLGNEDVVFGIEINGDFRAYPKRILAWHEMFTDKVGGIDVAGVYCTLCGTVILYKTELNGVKYNMGTSGFLYRSNKLMYDKKTKSLWNTIWGKPVVGPLVGKGIELDYLSVVTTTWGEWKKRHPKTKVLDLNTGYKRNYDEGIAYQSYFATDDLMFNVPKIDNQLKNKESILAIRFADLKEEPLAISVTYLKNNPIHVDKIGQREFVVFTDKTGANRVFDTGEWKFKQYDQLNTVTDHKGGKWTIYENYLENMDGVQLKRIHSFNAFWFGWKSAYPNTRLVK